MLTVGVEGVLGGRLKTSTVMPVPVVEPEAVKLAVGALSIATGSLFVVAVNAVGSPLLGCIGVGFSTASGMGDANCSYDGVVGGPVVVGIAAG